MKLLAWYIAPVAVATVIEAQTMIPIGVAAGTLLFVARLSARWSQLETRLDMFMSECDQRISRIEKEHSAIVLKYFAQQNEKQTKNRS